MKHRNRDSMDRIIPFVDGYYRTNHRSPSLRQISAGTGISRTTLHRMLNTMADSGIIGSIPCGSLSLEEEAVEEIVSLPAGLFGKGGLFLHPENPKYRDIPLLDCRIQGIAINMIKKL